MKSRYLKRVLIFNVTILLTLLTCGCGNDISNQVDGGSFDSPYAVFKNFPEKQFEELYLDMPVQDCKAALLETGFELKKGSNFNYYRNLDSTEIVLPDESTLSRIKIFLRSRVYLSQPNKLVDFYTEKAMNVSESDEFYVFNFLEGSSKFKLNLLIQESYLRISATLLKSG